MPLATPELEALSESSVAQGSADPAAGSTQAPLVAAARQGRLSGVLLALSSRPKHARYAPSGHRDVNQCPLALQSLAQVLTMSLCGLCAGCWL